MRTEVKYTIKNGDKSFDLVLTQLPPSKSLKFMIFMGKFLGGSAGKVIGAFDGSANSIKDLSNLKESDLSLEKVGLAISGLMERIDEDEVIEKINLLFESVHINGDSLHIDHFMFDGDPTLIFKVATKAIGVNYKRFLDENSGALGKIIASFKILGNTKE